MDKLTRSYRKTQLARVKKESKYNRTLKICGIDQNTNYMDITREEFEAIKQILTGEIPVQKKLNMNSIHCVIDRLYALKITPEHLKLVDVKSYAKKELHLDLSRAEVKHIRLNY